MNLYFNTDSLNFVNSPIDFSPVGNVSFIFGSSQSIGITLVNVANNGAYVLPSGYNMVLGLKPVGTFLSGNYLAYGSCNVVPDTGVGNYTYNITGFNLYTTGISGLLALNSSITLAMELEYDFNGSGVVLSNPNTCTIQNSYINLNQVPFMTGALAAYPAPNNVQTISNLGVTYLGTNQSGLFQPSGNYLRTTQSGLFYPSANPNGFVPSGALNQYYPVSNPSGFIPSGNIVAGENIGIAQSGNSLVISATGVGGGTTGNPNWVYWDNSAVTSFDAAPNSINAILTTTTGNLTVNLPTAASGLSDGTFVTFVDIYGWNNGFAGAPLVVNSIDGHTIYFNNGSNSNTETTSNNYCIKTYSYSASDSAWFSLNQFFDVVDSGVMSAGTLSYTSSAITPNSHFTLSHLCTSTGNRGALYVDSLSAGSVTFASTNPLDSDTISIRFN